MYMKNYKKIITAGVFAALICVLTAFLQIPIISGQGYVHLGDAVIYLAASILPTPYAAAAAAIGGGLADVLSGSPVWAPATIIIKALLTLSFTSKKTKMLCGRNALASAIGMPITVAGYYVAEALIYGSWVTPAASVIWNVAQAGASAAVFIIAAAALDKLSFKEKFSKQ